ncbi:MAG: CHAD domain-containing protein [Terriglobales bacterium]
MLVECDRATEGFDAEAVHDLRVALRRCRSLADGLRAIDPDASWKDMKKAGKKVFQALGELRDMQVMEEWIEKLGDPADPVAMRLLDHVHARENECKQHALKDLNQFDHKQWRQWSRSLPQRAARVRPGSVVYLHLALEKWTAAYDLHKHAMRSRSQVSYHQLRIGIKRFRYTVENFLPRQHAKWGDDLKELQDLLGEVHDLDVLWATAQNVDPNVGQNVDQNVSAFPDMESRKRWRETLTHERNKRLTRYREKMVGRQSLWQVWRAELPAGPQLRAAAMSRLRVWAGYLDPDFSHAQRVAQLGLQLYDGLRAAGLLATHAASPNSEQTRGDEESDWQYDSRAMLQAAAQMHDVGKARGAENHQKVSYRMIRGLARPLGWSARELELAAVVARYHRGALPHPRGKTMQSLPLTDRPIAMELAAILRLANALDLHPSHSGSREENETSPRLEVRSLDHFVLVRVAGYAALDRSAENVAAARHLLETVLRRPVLVRALRAAPEIGASRFRTSQATSNRGGVGGDDAHARARMRETRP